MCETVRLPAGAPYERLLLSPRPAAAAWSAREGEPVHDAGVSFTVVSAWFWENNCLQLTARTKLSQLQTCLRFSRVQRETPKLRNPEYRRRHSCLLSRRQLLRALRVELLVSGVRLRTGSSCDLSLDVLVCAGEWGFVLLV